jgi:hypothetical protein
LLTCEALLLQLHPCRALHTVDADFVTDRAGKLRPACGSKLHYALTAHASRTEEGCEALARLTDLITLRIVWSRRVTVVEVDPTLAARGLAAQIAVSVSTRFKGSERRGRHEPAPPQSLH